MLQAPMFEMREIVSAAILGSTTPGLAFAIFRISNIGEWAEGTSKTELREILEKLGVTPDKEIITHCQTHHRSSHTYVILKSMAYPRIKGYPGSWSEWGKALDLPIEN